LIFSTFDPFLNCNSSLNIHKTGRDWPRRSLLHSSRP
jgi:hypothetical protein